MDRRSAAMASSSRATSASRFSATSFVTTTRGSCSTAWPSPTPSTTATPRSDSGWRSTAGPGIMDWSSPAAIISAISMAVVWSASTSSSE